MITKLINSLTFEKIDNFVQVARFSGSFIKFVVFVSFLINRERSVKNLVVFSNLPILMFGYRLLCPRDDDNSRINGIFVE